MTSTDTTAEAIRSERDAFPSPRDIEIHLGRPHFGGIATHQDGSTLSTYLEVSLHADDRGTDEDRAGHEVQLGQSRHLLLARGR